MRRAGPHTRQRLRQVAPCGPPGGMARAHMACQFDDLRIAERRAEGGHEADVMRRRLGDVKLHDPPLGCVSGRSLCSLLLSASGTFRPSNVGPSPSWWQAEQAPSNSRWAGPGSGACAAALSTTARARAWVWAAGALALNEARYRASAWMSASGNGASARTTGVVSPIICRSALAIEAHRGVASLANTARYGPRDAPCAALRWLRAAYDI